ncbi:MAG: ATP-dependent Clp protease proteolytic subunit [Geodermatophilaceae bacterium]
MTSHPAGDYDPSRAAACAPRSAGMNLGDSVYERLLRERIVFLGSAGRRRDRQPASAPRCCCWPPRTPSRDINLYINSPGGSVTAGMAIYDTMQFIDCDVATVAMGLAASMGQFLLSAGTKGKRYALPHARIMMHQPSGRHRRHRRRTSPSRPSRSVYVKLEMAELHRRAHRPDASEQITEGLRPRPLVHRRSEALEYGFVDHVVARASQVPDEDRQPRARRPADRDDLREGH